MGNKEHIAAVKAAESVLFDPVEMRQDIPYTVNVPLETVMLFAANVSKFIDTHREMRERPEISSRVVNEESRYSLLRQDLADTLSSHITGATEFSITGRQVDTLAEVLLFDAEDIDHEGYERYISHEDQKIHEQTAAVFLGFLGDFEAAGGVKKAHHIVNFRNFVSHKQITHSESGVVKTTSPMPE